MNRYKKNIILGTAQFGLNYGINNLSGKPSQNNIEKILQKAISLDIKTLDTASSYGNSEELIGRFIKKHQFEFNINTKFIYEEGFLISDNLNRSLKKLNCHKVHTYFFHKFNDYITNLNLLNDLKLKKKIDIIGVSIYTNEEFAIVIEDKNIDLIQIPFNILDNNNCKGELIKIAYKKNKIIQARSVFLQGLLIKKENTLSKYFYPLKKYFKIINEISLKYNLTIEEIALKYVYSHPYINEIVIGVDNVEQLNNNINAFKTPLDKNIIDELNNIVVIEKELLNPVNWK